MLAPSVLLLACAGDPAQGGRGEVDLAGDDDDVGGDDDVVGDDDDEELPSCTGARFAQLPLAWELPDHGHDTIDGAPPFGSAGGYRVMDCGQDQLTSFATLDLTADGLPDLVLFRDDCGDPDLGRTHWQVYEGGSSGFSSQPTAWQLPDYGHETIDGQPVLDSAGGYRLMDCGQDRLASFATLDLTGDHVLDLVFFRDDCEDPQVGRARWLVYEGGEDGFSSQPTSWELPDYGHDSIDGDPPFDSAGGYRVMDCGQDQLASFATLDLTADGLLDLILFRDDCGDPQVGRTRWLVYEGSSSGFSSQPTAWQLPDYGNETIDGQPPFDSAGGSRLTDCGPDRFTSFATLDFTGDHVLDLAFFRDDCGSPQVGRAHWLLHEGGTNGFAASATLWQLPDYGHETIDGQPVLDSAGGYRLMDCGQDRLASFATLDLTGDHVLDLVFFRDDCEDPQAGRTHWQTYEGGEDGFSAQPTSWELPDYGHDSIDGTPPFDSAGGYRLMDCGQDQLASFATLDLTADGLLDLVLFRDDCSSQAVGRASWEVYPGECSE